MIRLLTIPGEDARIDERTKHEAARQLLRAADLKTRIPQDGTLVLLLSDMPIKDKPGHKYERPPGASYPVRLKDYCIAIRLDVPAIKSFTRQQSPDLYGGKHIALAYCRDGQDISTDPECIAAREIIIIEVVT